MKGGIVLLVITAVCHSVLSSGDEHTLHDDIFRNYSNKVRPRSDYHQAVDVELDLELTSINEIDEVNQIMYTIGHIIAFWKDDYLTWNPADYGGIDHIVVPPVEVWLPDIGIANSKDTFFHTTFHTDFRVTINYTGDILWSFGGNLATQCNLDLTHFPFDKQTCDIEIENWAYPKDAVNTFHGLDQVISENIQDNGIWHFENSSVTTKEIFHTITSSSPYPKVIFSLQLSRKPSFYLETLIIPCVLILCVQLAVFWMPAEAGEKASLGITVLLAFSVFQLVIDESTPNTSDYSPVMGQFILTVMTLSTFSTVLSIIVLYFHHKGPGSRVPRGVRVFLFKYCARILCMRSSVPEVDNRVEDNEHQTETMVVEDTDGNHPMKDKSKLPADSNDQLASIQKQIAYMVNIVKSKEADESIMDEWKALAVVIDRLFFWLVLVVSAIALPVMLTSTDGDH